MKSKLIETKEKGFALLEYAAGAVVIAGVVFAAMTLLGQNVSTLTGNVGTWAATQTVNDGSANQ